MDWFKVNQLSINLDKTVMMCFWPSSGNISVKVGDYKIPVVPFTKFLGVFLDESMSWKCHTEHLHNKLLMNKQLLTTSKNKLDRDSLQKVYFSHIHSHLTYTIKAWGPSLSAKKLEDLLKQQQKCIQVICSAKSTTPINFLFKELKILKLPDMIPLEQSKLGYQLKNKLLPKPLQIPHIKRQQRISRLKSPAKREKKPKMLKEAIWIHYWVIWWLIPQQVQKKGKKIKLT